MRKKLLLLPVFFVFFRTAVFAQSLNLEEARLLALANSRSLARYELAIRSSVLDERNQLYSMLPSVTAGYNASMNYLQNWEFVNPAETFTAGITFSVTQIIFQGGRGFIQKAIASIATESVKIDALAEYYNVLDAVDNAYYAALEAAAVLEAEESSYQSAMLSFLIAEVRQSTGMITAGDYLKALADKETRENSYNQARRNLEMCKIRLGSLTGINRSFELEPIDIGSYEQVLEKLSGITKEDSDTLYADFLMLILESNLSLAKAALNNERAEHSLSLVKRESAPTISATVFSTGLNYSTTNGFTSGSTGGLTIRGSVPLDFWVLSNRIEKSRISRDSAYMDYINTQSSLETELQNSLFSIYTSAGAVLSSRRSLEYTERHYEFVMERYRLSQSSVSELTDASSMYIASRNNHIRATYSFLQGLSKLRSLCAIDDEAKLTALLTRDFP